MNLVTEVNINVTYQEELSNRSRYEMWRTKKNLVTEVGINVSIQKELSNRSQYKRDEQRRT